MNRSPRGVAGLSRSALLARDANVPPPIRAADPDDNYLLALAAEQRAELVIGDAHLLELCDDPIQGPAASRPENSAQTIYRESEPDVLQVADYATSTSSPVADTIT